MSEKDNELYKMNPEQRKEEIESKRKYFEDLVSKMWTASSDAEVEALINNS